MAQPEPASSAGSMTFAELVANPSYVQRAPTAPIFSSHPLQTTSATHGALSTEEAQRGGDGPVTAAPPPTAAAGGRAPGPEKRAIDRTENAEGPAQKRQPPESARPTRGR